MQRHPHGFSLVELITVIAILALVAALGIPSLLPARISANETAAIATLRTLSTAQAQFQQRTLVDGNGDGSGEYGSFTELSGAGAGRMAAALVPTHLSGAFRGVSADAAGRGAVNKSGYWYRIWLPAPSRDGTCEDALGAFTVAPDAQLAAAAWCAYAWPASYQQSGNRTFFVNQSGEILATELAAFDGLENGPAADVAFSVAHDVVSAPAVNGTGQLPATAPPWRQAR
ncbi:MAG: type II secretion system protein [Planctomycetota bacterium]